MSKSLLNIRLHKQLASGKMLVASDYESYSLESYIGRLKAPPPFSECVCLVRGVATALLHLKKAGTVHGAVCPSNIFLSKGGLPRLTHPAISHAPAQLDCLLPAPELLTALERGCLESIDF